MNPRDREFTRRILIGGAIVTSFVSVVDVILSFSVLGRAGQLVLPIALLIVLFMLAESRLARSLQLIVIASVITNLTISTARMALAVTLAIISIWLATIVRARIFTLAFLGVLLSAQFAFWILTPQGQRRFTGGDESLGLFQFRISSEGRVNVWQIVAKSWQTEGNSPLSVLFGRGSGSVSEVIRNAGSTFAAPHNEFIRLYGDLGILGLLLAVCWVSVMVIRSRVQFRVSNLSEALVLLATMMCLIAFSLSDNPLSYPWFMVPLATLVAWASPTYHDSARR